jgi:NAD(P)H-hydrate repair Nnr-like enzyme with NAD(P)H-hydrate dehydratase domain
MRALGAEADAAEPDLRAGTGDVLAGIVARWLGL